MCSSKLKVEGSMSNQQMISHINGRPVLQPTCNRVSLNHPPLERRNSLKKPSNIIHNNPKTKTSPPLSPEPTGVAIKRGNDPNGFNSSTEKLQPPRNSVSKTATQVKKSRKCGKNAANSAETDSNFINHSAPGSIAAARREEVAMMQVQRKMKIAHYGRTKSAKYQGKVVPFDSASASASAFVSIPKEDQKRCSFITSNSDPIYIAYHDEEWGVPVHDDNLLLELLVLTAAQVGSDWTSVLKKRQEFRHAFAEFDAETVSKFSEKKIASIGADYGIEFSLFRGVVDNAKRILEIKKEFGSFDKYLWGFVSNKPIATQYKSCHKIPVKTSKSESMSKDMVRRGFRLVGPTVMHSFMQAAGLTNDHLITCPRHLQCTT